MGLTTTLSNALSGLSVTQSSLDVLARNISNSGTPGYHRQTVNVVDQTGTTSNYAISTSISRAFNQSLQEYYTTETADAGRSNVTASYLNQLQTYLGKPGSAGSLDTVFSGFQTALGTLTANPDDYSSRATAVSSAQTLAATLNHLTTSVQGLRQQASGQIQADVDTANQALASLGRINLKLGDLDTDAPSRAALLDQRDRLVSQVAGIIDVRAAYRSDGSVALATRAGVSLLDGKPSVFKYEPVTNILATSQFSSDDTQNGVGQLTLTTPAGLTLDLVKQNVLQGGELAGLVDLRDKLLVGAQGQLDGIAAGLAQAFSTNSAEGSAATGAGGAAGFSVDLASVQPGNDATLAYTVGGVTRSVRVVRVEDAGKLPLDYLDSDGTRVLGASFAGGAAGVATVLQQALGATGLQFSGAGTTLTALNDGTANSKVNGLTAHTTSTALQNAGLALNLFVDGGNGPFTNSLDGRGQRLGFAGRITVNQAVIADNTKLTQATTAAPIGDVSRVNHLFDQLDTMAFNVPATGPAGAGGGLSGTVSDLISQAMDYQGSTVASALSDQQSHQDAINSLTSRMTSEYGVDINSEMARLVQLQAAYSANARVVTVAQNLVNSLLQAVG